MATRPTQSVTGWAASGTIATTIPPGELSIGVQEEGDVPASWLNLFGAWLGYFDELSPSDEDLSFREWICIDDATYSIEWSAVSSPTTDGVLLANTKTVGWVLNGAGAVFGLSGTGTAGFNVVDGVYAHGFTYNNATGAVTAGSPPIKRDIYAPAAGNSYDIGATMTVSPNATGRVLYTTTTPSSAASACTMLPYLGGGKATETTFGDTTTYLHAVSIRVLVHNESGGGNPNTDVSLQTMDKDGTWTTRATANLTTIIAAGTDVALAPVASSVREIPRGAPMRLLVEHAAITGQTQQIEIQSVQIDYIPDAAA